MSMVLRKELVFALVIWSVTSSIPSTYFTKELRRSDSIAQKLNSFKPSDVYTSSSSSSSLDKSHVESEDTSKRGSNQLHRIHQRWAYESTDWLSDALQTPYQDQKVATTSSGNTVWARAKKKIFKFAKQRLKTDSDYEAYRKMARSLMETSKNIFIRDLAGWVHVLLRPMPKSGLDKQTKAQIKIADNIERGLWILEDDELVPQERAWVLGLISCLQSKLPDNGLNQFRDLSRHVYLSRGELELMLLKSRCRRIPSTSLFFFNFDALLERNCLSESDGELDLKSIDSEASSVIKTILSLGPPFLTKEIQGGNEHGKHGYKKLKYQERVQSLTHGLVFGDVVEIMQRVKLLHSWSIKTSQGYGRLFPSECTSEVHDYILQAIHPIDHLLAVELIQQIRFCILNQSIADWEREFIYEICWHLLDYNPIFKEGLVTKLWAESESAFRQEFHRIGAQRSLNQILSETDLSSVTKSVLAPFENLDKLKKHHINFALDSLSGEFLSGRQKLVIFQALNAATHFNSLVQESLMIKLREEPSVPLQIALIWKELDPQLEPRVRLDFILDFGSQLFIQSTCIISNNKQKDQCPYTGSWLFVDRGLLVAAQRHFIQTPRTLEDKMSKLGENLIQIPWYETTANPIDPIKLLWDTIALIQTHYVANDEIRLWEFETLYHLYQYDQDLIRPYIIQALSIDKILANHLHSLASMITDPGWKGDLKTKFQIPHFAEWLLKVRSS